LKTIHSDDNRLHFPQGELFGGELVTPFERPSRVEFVLNELKARGFTDISAPGRYKSAPVRKIHDARYLKFLETAWDEWMAAGYRGEIIPTTFPARRMQLREPTQIDGKVGYYALAVETAMTAGTWQAAKSIVRSGADSAAACRGWRALRIRPVPPAGSSRCHRHVWRLLLLEQRSHHGTDVP
jgi:acetoin utilization deacetylase AcuC-like enzyme